MSYMSVVMLGKVRSSPDTDGIVHVNVSTPSRRDTSWREPTDLTQNQDPSANKRHEGLEKRPGKLSQ